MGTLILKCILIIWLKTWYRTFTQESNVKKEVLMYFFPEHSYLALRRNSDKFIRVVLSFLFWFAFAATYGIVLKAVVLMSVIFMLHVCLLEIFFQIAIL